MVAQPTARPNITVLMGNACRTGKGLEAGALTLGARLLGRRFDASRCPGSVTSTGAASAKASRAQDSSATASADDEQGACCRSPAVSTPSLQGCSSLGPSRSSSSGPSSSSSSGASGGSGRSSQFSALSELSLRDCKSASRRSLLLLRRRFCGCSLLSVRSSLGLRGAARAAKRSRSTGRAGVTISAGGGASGRTFGLASSRKARSRSASLAGESFWTVWHT
mmetsp:Transcript_57353/g.134246  ORF Transcript_57353/g.134246 Transcript_57353/m.134246 type:complete len:222 (-) Transcript_57353:1784-2449(-)